jgi:hypothetical protein
VSSTECEELRPTETDLVGQWLDTGNRILGDAVCARIEWLVAERLQRVADANGGWDCLCRDTRDGRFWERTYPNIDWHGGGPPRLSVIAVTDIAAKYGLGTS